MVPPVRPPAVRRSPRRSLRRQATGQEEQRSSQTSSRSVWSWVRSSARCTTLVRDVDRSTVFTLFRSGPAHDAAVALHSDELPSPGESLRRGQATSRTPAQQETHGVPSKPLCCAARRKRPGLESNQLPGVQWYRWSRRASLVSRAWCDGHYTESHRQPYA
jgi:hypothetical protein